ncbi:mechanosensitive ion channel family protein [Sphingosinicella sp. CPCC 101087]|uniref:mechanosensitive ion channel family protein n=1 Tax=Sphingosinicella sp. CPCC 101087 TaxID=2497754 RepID=UPI00101E0AEF|nr:mechanosensitive ion channel domain-containing protein [Sphingosinicella sp. CPCC 101087]
MLNSDFSEVVVFWGLKVLYAAAVLAAGIWLAFFISRVARAQTAKNPRIDTTIGAFLARTIRYAIIVIVLIAVLQMFGVQTASLVAVLGASALAVGLALQGTLGNVASGIMIAFMRPFQIGDFVEINGQEGLVTELDLFFTEIVTLDDRRILVPNGQAVSNPITNFTIKGKRRCVIDFGVSYDDDLDQVIKVLTEVMTGDRRALAEPQAWFGVESLGDFAVTVSARVWIKTDDYLDYRADMMKRVKEAFDREGIEIPYPHAVEISKGEIMQRKPPVKLREEAPQGMTALPGESRMPEARIV